LQEIKNLIQYCKSHLQYQIKHFNEARIAAMKL